MNRRQQESLEMLGKAFISLTEEMIHTINDMANDEPKLEPVSGGDVMSENLCERTLTEPVPDLLSIANYEPHIKQVNNGFIVQCGCQSFVFETFEKMSKYLQMYFENPVETETKFYSNSLFN